MEKTYNNIGYLFIAIWIMALIGFHKTYTIFFPTFSGFRWEQHFHGAMLMAWFFMLIVQPFLIKYGKYDWHRTLGKVGYVLAPLVCISIFEVSRMVYFREVAHRPEQDVLAQLSLDIPAIFSFGLFALLAFINQKRTPAHVRYMIGTSLLMIGPGVGRALIIFGGVPFPISVLIVHSLSALLSFVFLLFDVWKRKNVAPSLVIFGVITFNVLCWLYQTSAWWLGLATAFKQVFF
ncbi:hypothetical protein [Spirosoma linguale]|uniref:Transmembrane protein n=1 Tax=Spirosoma linguale (strain ATCC 33905 / DSM 74 / LMG 10896 / Claus 1) TaxID=504472 RepID=D2QQ81_SPILD|nr:hypothetical protein Slin_3507 [Spirosoma linguale DSM 74]